MSVEQIRGKQSSENGGLMHLTIQERTHKEVAEILALTSTGKETKEQRTERNALLGEKLTVASDLAVAHAASKLNMSGLVGRELMKRLEDGKNIPLEPLFEYINEVMLPVGIHTKAQRKTLQLITDNVRRYAPTAPQDEIVNLLDGFVGGIIKRDTNLLTETLSWRQDADAITERVAEISLKESAVGKRYAGWQKQVVSHMKGLEVRANRLRNNRIP